MPQIRVNDCDLYYEVHGSGPELVFIHGEDHGMEMFDEQVAHFSRTHRCLTYYRRGHAKSELPPYGYSLWNQTLDLTMLLEALRFRHPVLVAVAMSTTIATTCAIEFPDKVRGLVLCSWYELDGHPLMEKRRGSYRGVTFPQLHMKMHELATTAGRDGLEEHMRREGDAFLPILPKAPDVREKAIRMFANHPAEHYVKAAEFYTSMPSLVPRMKDIQCPVLGICGDEDPIPDNPDLLRQLRSFREVWIQGARRFAMMDRPVEFNAAVEKFLTDEAASLRRP
jgi:pimeloyl-ACP methyl ester carboxylesterase